MPGLDAAPRTAVGIAPGKVILIGEHAVVHGEPAIALPLPAARVRATIDTARGPLAIDALGYAGSAAGAPEALQGLVATAQATLAGLGADGTGLLVSFQAALPHGRGLGSSAAAAVALVRALYQYHGKALPIDDLLALADVAERHAHGNPSGLDVATVAHEAPVWFQRGRAPEPLAVGGPFHFVVADTGRARDTRRAVSTVADRLREQPGATAAAIATLGGLAEGCRAGLASGDAVAIGAYMEMAQLALETLGVGSVELDALVRAARSAGALGAKLTGAGQGGCMLALAEDAEHQRALCRALLTAGAVSAWPFDIDPTNESICP